MYLFYEVFVVRWVPAEGAQAPHPDSRAAAIHAVAPVSSPGLGSLCDDDRRRAFGRPQVSDLSTPKPHCS
jgi:hypothetical protein